MPEAKDPKRALLTRWLKKRRKVLDGLPKGQWYQGGCRVNGTKEHAIVVQTPEDSEPGICIELPGCISICCNEDVASWFRESKEEMTKALDIIEELLSI